jgi:hypothetical protein
MGKGVSLHIGLNSVDPKKYEGWSGDLLACEFDAKDMAAIAKKQGFASARTIFTKKATADAVSSAIADAADQLKGGDLFWLTYSGHGSQVPDTNGDEPGDRFDETWVLWDRQLVDDELYDLWSRFKEGVRILVLSDSCHSGSVIREVLGAVRPSVLSNTLDVEPRTGMKAMPKAVADKVYRAHQEEYDKIQQTVPDGESIELAAHVVLMSGCQDNQTSADGTRNGLFTQTLKQVWNGGKFRGGHRPFWKDITAKMPPWQSPNYFTVGQTSQAFERSRPFTIA